MRTDQPLVSIITPVYNGQKYLAELIESVREQAYPNIEHIIIDDGSTDDGATLAILRHYPHLRWWSRENRGQYATMNEGLESAKGELVCFVSADDVLLPGAIRCVVEILRRNPEFDGLCGLTQFMDEAGNPYPTPPPFQMAPYRYYAYFSHISHCSLYIKRVRLLEKSLFFDPSLRYVGDYDWILRILDVLKVYPSRIPLSKVRIHAEQTSKRNVLEMRKEHRRVVASHRISPLLYKLLTGVIIFVHNTEKMGHAWSQDGYGGVKQLMMKKIRRRKSIEER